MGYVVVAGRITLRTSGVVQLDASGDGAVDLQPNGTTWEILGMSVEVTPAQVLPTDEYPHATITIAGGYISDTASGHRATDDAHHVLSPSEVLTCTWTGGVPNARAVLRIWGWQQQGVLR